MSAQMQGGYLDRPDAARRANDHIARKAERLGFVSRVPMVCECSDRACESIFLVALAAYRELRARHGSLTTPGHAVAGAEPRLRRADYWLHFA
jgi:hypothetical protein